MAKKKQEDIPLGSPAWMATFSDLMNLLLCFFVLLFSMSSVDAAKWEAVVASFNNDFSIWDAGGSAIGEGKLVSNGVSQLNNLENYINNTGTTEDTDSDADDVQSSESDNIHDGDGGDIQENNSSGVQEGNAGENDGNSTGADSDTSHNSGAQDDNQGNPSQGNKDDTLNGEKEDVGELLDKLEDIQLSETEQMFEAIEDMLEESRLDKEIDIDFTSQYVELSLKGAFLFDSASANLKKEAMSTLDMVAIILETYPESLIEIEGHTDNVPLVNHSKYEDNDALSDARAREVFHYLVDNSLLDPSMMKHAGRGEYDPVADNSTAEGRQKNRRVVIKIYNSISSY